MGISCIIRNTYSILPLLLLILIITPSSLSLSSTDIVTKEFLNKLCLETSSHSFCVNWLTADNRTNSISIHGLMKLTVKKTRAFGLKNLVLMSEFARGSGNDKKLKKAYESCVNSYGIAIKELERAQEFLNNSSFQLAFYAASKAFEYAYICKDEFEGPSNEPSRVLQHSEKFIDMCYIARLSTGLLNWIHILYVSIRKKKNSNPVSEF